MSTRTLMVRATSYYEVDVDALKAAFPDEYAAYKHTDEDAFIFECFWELCGVHRAVDHATNGKLIWMRDHDSEAEWDD